MPGVPGFPDMSGGTADGSGGKAAASGFTESSPLLPKDGQGVQVQRHVMLIYKILCRVVNALGDLATETPIQHNDSMMILVLVTALELMATIINY